MRKWVVLLPILLVCLAISPTVYARQEVTPIAYGDEVGGRLVNADDMRLYSFEGGAGDVVSIQTVSDSLDTYLVLVDEQGNTLAENDDTSQTNLNAALTFTLSEAGTYYIGVAGYQAGDYTLILAAEAARPAAPSSEEIGVLGYGDEVEGAITEIDTPVIYQFAGTAGEVVILDVASDQIDPYVVLANAAGEILAENDDVSQDDLNAYLEYVLPTNGDYLIGVYGYETGDYQLLLDLSEAAAVTPVETGVAGDETTGTINADNPYVAIPVDDVREGETITIDARATSGDLDLYLALVYGEDAVVAENDDRDSNDLNPLLEYPQAQAGDYTVLVTRYGFEEGETAGDFAAMVKVSAAPTSLVSDSTSTSPPDPTASGYPTVNATSQAEWTVLVYMGGDNNLEDDLLNDLDEFEIAGGSTQKVRIVALLDRSDEYGTSNGDWADTRVFELGADSSQDAASIYPPTVDTRAAADLGELDTSYGNNLSEFLVWGMRAYPAQHYVVILNDHGGAWSGIVTDDTTGNSILTIPELRDAFAAALTATGVPKFDLLINDACLMSSLEYYAAIAPYFDYVISSPEITLTPSFDMTLLTQVLNHDPAVDLAKLGQLLVDKYMQDMDALSPDTSPVLGAAVTDLRQIDGLVQALENFASLVNSKPKAFGSLIGQVRSNTYAYSFFLPEDEYGPATAIDLGNFMQRVLETANDAELKAAAQQVLDAMDAVRLYGTAGRDLTSATSYYNIYFPSRSTDFDPGYFTQSPLQNWAQMLRGYYGSVSVNARGIRAGAGAPAAAPSLVPIVTITNVFPLETSVAFPITVSMEVLGRNISRGIFTVDQIQPDGTAVRLDSSLIVTEVVRDGVVEQLNQWSPGVDDSDFAWEVVLPVVTDGIVSQNELVVNTSDVTSLAGRYRYPGSDNWVDVTILFDDEGYSANVLNSSQGSTAFASIRLEPGGEFQTYRSLVTPDGRVTSQPGTVYTWPEEGIRWYNEPAPSGQYNLGFLVEAFGGVTGFDSVTVTVKNDAITADLRGYVDDDWGFIFQRPADWFDVTYFPDSDFLQTGNFDDTEYIFVYPVYEAQADLEAIANEVLDRYEVTFDGRFVPTNLAGQSALSFTFTYVGAHDQTFTANAFAVYRPDEALGLVFSAEAVAPAAGERLSQLLIDHLSFFDVQDIQSQDTGLWDADTFAEGRYPVREDWLPGASGETWWYYTPGNDVGSSSLAAVSALNPEAGAAQTVLQSLLEADIAVKPGYLALGAETYYGENNTWEMASFSHDGANGEVITGRLYVTETAVGPFALWFEAPADEFDATFREVFTVMLDGFTVAVEAEVAS